MSVFAGTTEEQGPLYKKVWNYGYAMKWEDDVLLVECPPERMTELARLLGPVEYVACNAPLGEENKNALCEYWERKKRPAY